MQLATFKAPTMAEALSQVKKQMGFNAVILHTRTYARRYWLGLRRQEIVEITAGQGLNIDRRRTTAGKTPPRPPVSSPPKGASNVVPGLGAPRHLLETPAASSAAMLGLTQDMTCLKTMVKDLVSQVRHQRTPQVPEELFDHYLHLVANQVSEELAVNIVKNVERQCRPEQLAQPQIVQERLAQELEKLIKTAGALSRTKASGPHVVALIGPTGVGKTTTIAKLAANLKLRERRSVGLITIDTYRIAAVEQLKKYADIIGSPLKIVGSPEDLRDGVASMSQCDFVLIDTAGRSPNDALKLHELKSFLAAASPDEVHLVLSTTASQSCVELAIERFTDVRVDKIIFTKLDEAAHIGVVLNVINKVNKSLSYITTGQDVPDDIEVGRGRRLAQMILQGGGVRQSLQAS